MTPALKLAREAFALRAWTQALEAFASADGLERADHERIAIAAYLSGADERCERAWEAAHHAALDDGESAEAARCAFWLGLCLMLRGQMAQAGGWLSRTESIIAESGVDCAASGYLLIPALLSALDGGDAADARDLSVRALDIGRRFDDADLRAFAVIGLGQALIALGNTVDGTAHLDEVMVSVTSGEVGPITSGIVYCAVILECMALFDLARAAEWTGALSDWCDVQPDLVPYRGQCLVHRSQLQMVAGHWSDAITTAEAACRRLTDPPHPALGLACYQEGELHRLLGAMEEAEAAYRRASRHGHDPVPGLALLELARGDIDAAVATVRRALHEARTPALLAAAVDIFRAAGDVAGARAAADELATFTDSAPSAVLRAMVAQARGAVLVAEGDPVAGLNELRAAARAWQSLRMPYEAARTAVLLGLACAALGDRGAASLELDNARVIFTELGARPDLARVDAFIGPPPRSTDDAGLSDRERQVLAQLASGKTNREIASVLHISQHTVGRHVENIFAKLAVTSRAAATARAYELDLISR
jgi:DNA-binding CsgD family transcriptional regulator